MSFSHVPLCRFRVISAPLSAICLRQSSGGSAGGNCFSHPLSPGQNTEQPPCAHGGKRICRRDPPVSIRLRSTAPPDRTTLEFSLVPDGQHSFPRNWNMGKGSELTKVFFPSSLWKREGAKASNRAAVVPPVHVDWHGLSCSLPAGFQLGFTSRRHLCLRSGLCSCALPSQRSPGGGCLSERLAAIKPCYQPCSVNHFSVTHRLLLRNSERS